MSAIGQAGRRGDKVRSDCWISVELKDAGGIEISLKSRVQSMYGDSIRKSVTDGLDLLGIKDAVVEVEDAGAVPFVIWARLEAAVKHANPGISTELLPPQQDFTTYGTTRDRFRRSRLYLPGDQVKLMLNAGLHGPDGVIVDLEDSVAHSQKDAARYVVRNVLRSVDFFGAERMVRINQLPMGLDDLPFIVPHNIHIILIPKCETADDVRAVDAKVQEIRKENGIENEVYLMPIIESAKGCFLAYEIATASPNIVALTIGLEDYTADIGTQRTNEGTESFWARSQVVNAARAAHVQPIDTVFSDVTDMDALMASVIEAKGLGFDGKGCIHPRQIETIHAGFAPAEAEVAKATRIVVAFEKAEAEGLGVVSLGSKMIDPPVVKRALRTVNLAVASGVLPEDWRGKGGDDA
ncbi:MAG TPA: aldolase/citrate lyase family protein [bacterium]|nr:aldolase/citrate lyase family protein [bacterium]